MSKCLSTCLIASLVACIYLPEQLPEYFTSKRKNRQNIVYNRKPQLAGGRNNRKRNDTFPLPPLPKHEQRKKLQGNIIITEAEKNDEHPTL